MSLSGSKPKAPVIKRVSIPYCGLFVTLRSNYSLKRTAAYRRLCYHAVTRQRPLSSSVRPRKQLFSCVSRSPQRFVLRFAHCSCSAFSLLLSLGCAGLRVALGSSTWRARNNRASVLAGRRAGTASHRRLASSNGWLGYVGSGQLYRFQRTRQFRTHGGPNYSLKADRCGLAAVLSCDRGRSGRLARPLGRTESRVC